MGAVAVKAAVVAGVLAAIGLAVAAPGCQGDFFGPYTCEPGYASCGNPGMPGNGSSNCNDHSCDCRTNLMSDPNNCGSCFTLCNGKLCQDGGCPYGVSGSGSGGDCTVSGCPAGQICKGSTGMSQCVSGSGSGGGSGSSSGGPPPSKLPEPLTQAAAAVGNNGKVYVLGGVNKQLAPSKALYIYDPMSNSWSRGKDMANARAAPCMNVQGDGSILAFGGFDASGNAIGAIEQLNAFNGMWGPMGTMQTPRGAMACGGNGQIVAAGGSTTANGPPLAIVESVPMMGGSYPPMPTARAWAGGGSLNGGIFLAIGGAPSLNVVEALDNFSWVSAAPMPTGRGHLAVTSANFMGTGILVALGGRKGGGVVAAFEAYDSNSHSWTQLTPMPTPREGLAAAATGNGPNGSVYAIGGDDGATPPHVLDLVETYTATSSTGAGFWQ